MKWFRLVVPVSLVMIAACAANAAPTTPFMSKAAPDAKELVKQVSKDRTLATRYAKHFGTTPAAVISYYRENLRLGQLTRPHVTAVYSIGLNGNPTKKVMTLRPGTKVFSTTWGDPVIEWETGNPLVDKLPLPPERKPLVATMEEPAKAIDSQPNTAKAEEQLAEAIQGKSDEIELSDSAKTSIAQTTERIDDVVTKVMSAPPMETASAPGTDEVISIIPDASSNENMVVATRPGAVGGTPAPAGEGRGISNYANWWRPFAAVGGGLALISMISSGGSGDNGSSDTPSLPPSVVPEPASLLALTAGLALLARRRMR